MSWNFCAISGEQLVEPVVSRKSGHVFEKRVIEKHITSTGKCPLTEQQLSNEDLIEVKLAVQTKPRQVSMNSVPGILKSFQSEWDSLILETYTLKQHLETVRQELSHALYQHDAACRVIARLLKERDEARKEVSQLQDKLQQEQANIDEIEKEEDTKAQASQEEKIEEEVKKLPSSVIESINETALKLNALRKERKRDGEYTSKFLAAEGISSFGPRDVRKLEGELNVMDMNRDKQLLVLGGQNGNISIFDLNTKQLTATTQLNTQKILQVAFLGEINNQIRIVAVTENSVHAYSYAENALTQIYSHSSQSQVVSVATHPNGSLFIVAEKDSLQFHDLNTNSLVLTVTSLVGQSQINQILVHPDGNLLAIACSDGSVKLWNMTANQLLTSLQDGIQGGVELLNFSENGYILAAGSKADKVVKIFDLRKIKCIATIKGSEVEQQFAPTSIEFDRLGTVLAIGSDQGQIKIVDTKKWNILSSISAHNQQLSGLKFNNFSLQLVSISLDQNIALLSQ